MVKAILIAIFIIGLIVICSVAVPFTIETGKALGDKWIEIHIKHGSIFSEYPIVTGRLLIYIAIWALVCASLFYFFKSIFIKK